MSPVQECKAWSILALSALAIAGGFALLLVLSRTPGVQDVLPWSWQVFFHQGLVVHVIFSFVVWFLATMGALYAYHYALHKPDDRSTLLGRAAVFLSGLACLGLMLPALFDLGAAELNNYVPVMNHWTYYLGLVLLALALVLVTCRQLALSGHYRNYGPLDYMGVIYLLGLVAFGFSYLLLPDGLISATYNERLFWAGGHILQFVNTALLIIAWAILCRERAGREFMPYALQTALIGVMALFCLLSLSEFSSLDVLGQSHRDFFTDLLRYGLPVPSVIASGYLIYFLIRSSHELDGLSRTALWLSVVTYNLGGLFGLFLDGTDTRVPAHYHAVIGGINLSFMILYHRVLLPFSKVNMSQGKWTVRLLISQYWLYGLGQIMHASGMYLAGSQGVPRKTSGDAQALDSMDKILSMSLMGIGGLIAVLGGVLFVIMTLRWLLKNQEVTL